VFWFNPMELPTDRISNGLSPMSLTAPRRGGLGTASPLMASYGLADVSRST